MPAWKNQLVEKLQEQGGVPSEVKILWRIVERFMRFNVEGKFDEYRTRGILVRLITGDVTPNQLCLIDWEPMTASTVISKKDGGATDCHPFHFHLHWGSLVCHTDGYKLMIVSNHLALKVSW